MDESSLGRHVVSYVLSSGLRVRKCLTCMLCLTAEGKSDPEMYPSILIEQFEADTHQKCDHGKSSVGAVDDCADDGPEVNILRSEP